MFQSKLIYTVVALAALTPFQPSHAGTIAHFTFENDFLDISGNGHSLIQRGAFSFTSDVASTNPNSNRALQIAPNNFLDSTINLPDQNFTVEFFAKASSTGQSKDRFGNTAIVSTFDHTQTDGDGLGGFILVIDASDNYVVGGGPDNQTVGVGSSFGPDDSWRHLAFTLSSSRVLELFVDGVSQGTAQAAGTSNPFANTLRIGSSFLPSFVPPQDFYNGLIDDLRISDVALTPDQFLTTASAVPVPPIIELFAFTLFALGLRRRGIFRNSFSHQTLKL